jgi:hypothetical protein
MCKKTFTYYLFPYNFHNMIFKDPEQIAVTVIREITLANGLTVRFLDKTQPYFGDYHHVRLEAVCDIPAPEIEGADSCRYMSNIRRMGVPTADVPAVIDELISHFSNTTLTYMSSPEFPLRYVSSRMSRKSSHDNMKFTPGF